MRPYLARKTAQDIVAMDFRHTGAGILYGTPAALNDIGAQSVVALVWIDGTGNRPIYHKGATSTRGPLFRIEAGTGGPIIKFYADSTGTAGAPNRNTSSTQNGDGGTLNSGRWYVVAATWDGALTATGIELYFATPGARMQKASTGSGVNGTTAIASDAALTARIGTDTISQLMGGDLGYVGVWAGILTVDQLTRISQYGPFSVPNDLRMLTMQGRDWSGNNLSPTSRVWYGSNNAMPQRYGRFATPAYATVSGWQAVEVTNSPLSGSITFTGTKPSEGITVSPVSGSIGHTCNKPSIGIGVSPVSGVEGHTGYAPVLHTEYANKPSKGTETYTGKQPAIGLLLELSNAPATGAETFTGKQPTIALFTEIRATVTPATGAATYTGQQPNIGIEVSPVSGSVTYTGTAPLQLVEKTNNPATGTEAYTGEQPSIGGNRLVDVLPLSGGLLFIGKAPKISLFSYAPINSPVSGVCNLNGTIPTIRSFALWEPIDPVTASTYTEL